MDNEKKQVTYNSSFSGETQVTALCNGHISD